jgi:hypothetical protein
MKFCLILFAFASTLIAADHSVDVVVYGGTAGGVMAALSAAREGLSVALVEPTAHLGGMVSGGLGFTDVGKRDVIGGYALEFYLRLGRYYQISRYGQDIAWQHEPHVAEEIFRQMLQEAGVQVFDHHQLREQNGVERTGTVLQSLTTGNNDTFHAKIFIDSSYEGDLMGQAHISYTSGREGVKEYGESLAGVRTRTPFHQFLVDIPARKANGELYAEINPAAPAPPGSADHSVQSYNFRMCFCDDPANQITFEKPEGYDPARYALLAALLAARTKQEGQVPKLATLLKIDPLPNHKADVNNNGPFSTDYIGGSWHYPSADYAERSRIWQEHKKYQAGLFFFLANDPQVPESVREEMKHWGLCKDEFTDTDHWPYQLYVRESRRMLGEYVAVQKDLQDDLTKPDAIGMGSYNSDSHNVERIVDPAGFVRNEGDMQVAVKPYQIPYRIMLPKRAEATNLLVPVAFSASHVAYSSIRMEPQYMIIGQAAGVAAKLSITSSKPVQQIDVAALQENLKANGAVLEYLPSGQEHSLSLAKTRLTRLAQTAK